MYWKMCRSGIHAEPGECNESRACGSYNRVYDKTSETLVIQGRAYQRIIASDLPHMGAMTSMTMKAQVEK